MAPATPARVPPRQSERARARRVRGRCLFPVAVLALGAFAAGAAPAGPRVLWMWSGAVTTSSAIVKARVLPPGTEARIVLSEDPDLLRPVAAVTARAEAGIAAFALGGLAPATRYFYAVEAGSQRSATGRLRTFGAGPMSFRVAAGSCASTGSRGSVFLAIDRLAPDLFVHMGDLHYENIRQPLASRFFRAFDDVFSSGPQAALYRHVPIAYVWDDHDYGPNNADRTSPSRSAAQAAYRAAVPHYPLSSSGPIHQAFTIGRVRVILSDVRSERSPERGRDAAARTLLGEAQRVWLLEQFADATSFPLVVWVNPVPWITREGRRSDGWQPYARERALIADTLDRLGLTRRLVMVSGDAHMAALDDGTNSNYATAGHGGPGFPVLHAAPLDRRTSRKGGPYSHGVSLRRGQFGLLEVQDDGTTLRVTLSGRDAQGGAIPRLSLSLACDGLVCRPTGP